MKIWRTTVIKAIALAVVFAGVAFGQDPKPAVTSAAPSADPSQGSQDRPVLQHRNQRYQISRDDVLSISFPLSPELNQKVTVHPDGYVVLQNIGSIYILGMTVPEVVDAVK